MTLVASATLCLYSRHLIVYFDCRFLHEPLYAQLGLKALGNYVLQLLLVELLVHLPKVLLRTLHVGRISPAHARNLYLLCLSKSVNCLPGHSMASYRSKTYVRCYTAFSISYLISA